MSFTDGIFTELLFDAPHGFNPVLAMLVIGVSVVHKVHEYRGWIFGGKRGTRKKIFVVSALSFHLMNMSLKVAPANR
jgi:hypothetical protein